MRTWPLLLIGFGALLLLIGGSAVALRNSLGEVYGQVAAVQARLGYERDLIDTVRADLFLSAILVRDYLLDPSVDPAAPDRARLEELRSSVESNLASLEQTGSEEQRAQVTELRKAVVLYWRSLDPLFEWSPQ